MRCLHWTRLKKIAKNKFQNTDGKRRTHVKTNHRVIHVDVGLRAYRDPRRAPPPSVVTPRSHTRASHRPRRRPAAECRRTQRQTARSGWGRHRWSEGQRGRLAEREGEGERKSIRTYKDTQNDIGGGETAGEKYISDIQTKIVNLCSSI